MGKREIAFGELRMDLDEKELDVKIPTIHIMEESIEERIEMTDKECPWKESILTTNNQTQGKELNMGNENKMVNTHLERKSNESHSIM